MKIYLIQRKKTNVRWFDNDKDLTDFLLNAPERIDSYQVLTFNGDIESEKDGHIVLEGLKEKTEIDSAVAISKGDEYSVKVYNLIELYKKLCKKAPWDNKKMSPSALKVFEKMITTPSAEKDFLKLGKGNIEYLIYCVSSSVEWYEALLGVYPKINKLAETCRYEYVDPVTYGTKWEGGRTPKEMVKNFEKAKKLANKK